MFACFLLFQAQICKKQVQNIKNDLSQSAFGQDLTQKVVVRSKPSFFISKIFVVVFGVFQLQIVSRALTHHCAQKTDHKNHKKMSQKVKNEVGVQGAALVFQDAALRSALHQPPTVTESCQHPPVSTDLSALNVPTCQQLMRRRCIKLELTLPKSRLDTVNRILSHLITHQTCQ